MAYQLGQYVGAHNRRMNRRAVAVPLAAAFQAGGQLAGRVYNAMPSFSEQRIVAKAVRAAHELKNIDNDEPSNTFSLTATPVFFLLNGMQQGTSANERTGRIVKPETLRLSLSCQQNVANQSDYYRFIVFQDNESRGAQATVTDLLAYTGQGLDQINSPINYDNNRRFQFLLDKVFCVNATAGVTTAFGSHATHFETTIRLGRKTDYYNTSSGTITDIDAGAIFLMVIAQQGTNAGFFTFNSRILYRDL